MFMEAFFFTPNLDICFPSVQTFLLVNEARIQHSLVNIHSMNPNGIFQHSCFVGMCSFGFVLSWKVIGEGKNKMESQILLFIMENTEVNEHERYRVK